MKDRYTYAEADYTPEEAQQELMELTERDTLPTAEEEEAWSEMEKRQ